MTIKFPNTFSAILPDIKTLESGTEWHFKAFILWHLIPPEVHADGLAWLLGHGIDAMEKLKVKFGWPSRCEMRKEAKKQKKSASKERSPAISKVQPSLNKRLMDIDGDIPKVNLLRLIKFVEFQIEQGARDSSPGAMNNWLSTLAGLDAAQRARQTRRIESIKKDSIKIYMPAQDPIPDIDIEDAKIVPPPVAF